MFGSTYQEKLDWFSPNLQALPFLGWAKMGKATGVRGHLKQIQSASVFLVVEFHPHMPRNTAKTKIAGGFKDSFSVGEILYRFNFIQISLIGEMQLNNLVFSQTPHVAW